ncbi:MAG: radical SAM protein [Fimbriimonadaceae bacterium]|nr:radical SAM protein [Fimbriimonadaceae bacterium]
MLSVTRLLCGTATPGDALRYGRHSSKLPAGLLHFSADKKPVLVWNCTRRCDLKCVHCYASAADRDFPGELTTAEGFALLDDLAGFGIPVVLFSGGEPLLRPDLFELAGYAKSKGMRAVLSTNGMHIDAATADRIKETGFSYVGISLDGLQEVHDKVRGVRGAFQASLEGIRRCRERDIRVGLRYTVHKLNIDELPGIFDLLETEDIPRCCFYHLAYAGRGDKLKRFDLEPPETRRAVEYVFERTADFHQRGLDKDILTVDNHTDNAFLYLKLAERDPERAAQVLQMLEWNGGNQSGIAIGCVDNEGNVHPDQFSWHVTLGNVRERPFSEIWEDRSHPLMALMKEKPREIGGRCGRCRFFGLCNGNLRVRAHSYYGDWRAEDPACYLTEEEIDPSVPLPRLSEEVTS